MPDVMESDGVPSDDAPALAKSGAGPMSDRPPMGAGPPEGEDLGPPGGDPGPPGGDPGPPDGMPRPGDVPKLTWPMVQYFWPYLRKDKGKMIAGIGILMVIATFPAVSALLPMLLTSNWVPGRVHYLWWGLAGLLLFGLLSQGLQYLLTLYFAQVSQNFGQRMRLAIFRKIGNLPTVAMNVQSVGSLAYRSTSDVMRIQDLLTPNLPMALRNGAEMFFMIVALFVLGRDQPGYACLSLVLIPIIWVFASRINNRVRHYARIGQRQNEDIMTRFIEGVSGYRDLVAAGRYDDAATAFDGQLDGLRRTQIRTAMVNFWSGFVPMVGFMLLMFGYYFARTMNLAKLGDMEYIGRVISFAMIIGMVQRPAILLANFFTEAALAAPSFFEVRRLLDAPQVPDVAAGQKPANSAIRLESVSFGYGRGAPPILRDVSFDIPPGSFTAIVGQTGSGKSTLFYLLLRLLEPLSGVIRVGGESLSDISLSDLRDFVGFIPQSPFIFDATIRENLCMGVPNSRFEEQRIEEAIRLARLERLVASRQQAGGLEAPVGPGGATLSGGERQRIALGRIFLRDPQIIVCDEYTANIDNATAKLIHQALEEHFAGKTRIVITHQLYTVRGADKILVLDRGRIADSGTHQELLERPGLYREMWEVQRLE